MIKWNKETLIGVLADTHGNSGPLIRALDVFKEHNINTLIHAGDFGPADDYKYYRDFTLYLVSGNNDDLNELQFYSQKYSQPQPLEIRFIDFNGKSVVVYHGEKNFKIREAVEGNINYLIKGHSHTIEDYFIKNTRILNPGALYRSAFYSVGIFDPLIDLWKTIEIRKN